MPHHPLPAPTHTAQSLDIPQGAHRPPTAERHDGHGDPTLVALTVEEAARRLGIGRTTMYALVSSGQIRSVKIGRLRRIPAQALTEYLTAQAGVARSDVTLAA
ncbi:helix-turn-helix domain-containing protein [Streptomyces sp. B1866]|uniref:helix-turn-helix domain-containing protein n=1 Tax=Streptomyces sp. B1866 TaxID=3075431 RepID=UPI002891B263|nr:helix-turn-helix domain-containing protein [Streptomyces sp. B1866]MDT3395804.1 helix-turn-helix domain-containing protein [Streptomyces sp. B1866]